MKKIDEVMEKEKIVVTTEADWMLVFEELKSQWGKRGRLAQSILLTNDDFMHLQYRIGMKINREKVVLDDENSEFSVYIAAMKYIALSEKMLENLMRAKNYFTKMVGTLNPINVVEVYFDEDEYKEYCELMNVEGNFLGRKNI
ncbi:hypothetical protein [Lacrimispora sp. 38-1]|uniref:hypothetical protein n=1 Tax=Lacrimispora sp. 38-1 TaxID=3125778 RepID=UPI003CED4911